MAHDNLALVRNVYERWRTGDFGTEEAFDPLVLFVLNPEFPDAGRYLGVESMIRYTRGLLEPWSRFTIEARDLAEAGDTVVAAVTQRGTGHGSAATTEFHYYQVWTLRGGKVIRLDNFRERAEALEAAGLTDAARP